MIIQDIFNDDLLGIFCLLYCSARKVKVATVDSFQGGERDIIILSCARTDQMGFGDDVRSVLPSSLLILLLFANNFDHAIIWTRQCFYAIYKVYFALHRLHELTMCIVFGIVVVV